MRKNLINSFFTVLLLSFFSLQVYAAEKLSKCSVSYSGTYTYYEGAGCAGIVQSDLTNNCTVKTKAVLCSDDDCTSSTDLKIKGIPGQFYYGTKESNVLVAYRDVVYSDENGNFTFEKMPCKSEGFGTNYKSEFRFNWESMPGYISILRRSDKNLDSIEQNAYTHYSPKGNSNILEDNYGGIWFLWKDDAFSSLPKNFNITNVKIPGNSSVSKEDQQLMFFNSDNVVDLLTRNFVFILKPITSTLGYNTQSQTFNVLDGNTKAYLKNHYSEQFSLEIHTGVGHLSVNDCSVNTYEDAHSIPYSISSSNSAQDVCLFSQSVFIDLKKEGSSLSVSETSRVDISISKSGRSLPESIVVKKVLTSQGRVLLQFQEPVSSNDNYSITASLGNLSWNGYLNIDINKGVKLWKASGSAPPSYGSGGEINLKSEVVEQTGLDIYTIKVNLVGSNAYASSYSPVLSKGDDPFTPVKKIYNSTEKAWEIQINEGDRAELVLSLKSDSFLEHNILVGSVEFDKNRIYNVSLPVIPKHLKIIHEFQNIPANSVKEILFSWEICGDIQEPPASDGTSTVNKCLPQPLEESSKLFQNSNNFTKDLSTLSLSDVDDLKRMKNTFIRLSWDDISLANGLKYLSGRMEKPINLGDVSGDGIILKDSSFNPKEFPPVDVVLKYPANTTVPSADLDLPDFIIKCGELQPVISIVVGEKNQKYKLSTGDCDDGDRQLKLGGNSAFASEDVVVIPSDLATYPWTVQFPITSINEDFNNLELNFQIQKADGTIIYDYQPDSIIVTLGDKDFVGVQANPEISGYKVTLQKDLLNKTKGSFSVQLPGHRILNPITYTLIYEKSGEFSIQKVE